MVEKCLRRFYIKESPTILVSRLYDHKRRDVTYYTFENKQYVISASLTHYTFKNIIFETHHNMVEKCLGRFYIKESPTILVSRLYDQQT